MFIGRKRELDVLGRLLTRVRTSDDRKPGQAILIRGRRRVGKSRLVEEFIDQADLPSLYFAASRQDVPRELDSFMHALAESSLPRASEVADAHPTTWAAALRIMIAALPADGRPAVIVIDELPYLIERDPDFEGVLQQLFDRELSTRRVLLVCIGSDLAMMELLDEYGHPFHQRAKTLAVSPLSPAEVGAMIAAPPAQAFDAYLITGGLPLICGEWERGQPLDDYLAHALADPTSALIVSAERSLAAEFPTEVQARHVLTAVGNGARTFTKIQHAAGLSTATALTRSLAVLQDKGIVSAEQPLSTKKTPGDKRYLVTDPYLRFWLEFIGPGLQEIERGRGDRVHARFRQSWTAWRGQAVEPVLRDALYRLAPEQARGPDGSASTIGSYWTRTNDVEVDIVAADRAPVAKKVFAVGSIKWLENAPFDNRHLAELVVHRSKISGAADAGLIAISRSGCTADGVTCFGPEDLLAGDARIP